MTFARIGERRRRRQDHKGSTTTEKWKRLGTRYVRCELRDHHRPLLYRRRRITNSSTAPIVETMISVTIPVPSQIPSCGSSQLPIKAPTIPMQMSATNPYPVPLTICPASHPAIRPTSRMTRIDSFDISISAIPPYDCALSRRSRNRLRSSQRPPVRASHPMSGQAGALLAPPCRAHQKSDSPSDHQRRVRPLSERIVERVD